MNGAPIPSQQSQDEPQSPTLNATTLMNPNALAGVLPTSVASSLLSNLTAFAALQPSFAGTLPMSPALDFTHGGGIEAEAKLVDYRGEKVAGFDIDGDTLICLPQAYELFLKSLVGGLHTVYTKLKRLDILPRVCNVEQVRALRSLGAIQPGVNRCKLISCKDFDVLYDDCTSTNSRPGRPPKRSPISGASGDPTSMYFFKRPKIDGLGDLSGKLNGASLGSMMAQGLGGTSSPTMPNGAPGANMSAFFAPFSAAAAQQLMMQQMMASGLLQQQNNQTQQQGARSSHSTDGSQRGNQDDREASESPTPKPLWIDAPNDCGHPLNLSSKPLAETNDMAVGSSREASASKHSGSENGDLDADEDDENDDEFNDENEVDDARDSTSTNGDNMNAGTTTDEQLQQQHLANIMANWPNVAASMANQTEAGGTNSSSGVNKLSGYGSVHALLVNILGFVEVAVAAARNQEEQFNNEKSDVASLLARERAEKSQLESQLLAERRQRKIFSKRWRQAHRLKNKLKDQVNAMLSAAQPGISTNHDQQSNPSGMQDGAGGGGGGGQGSTNLGSASSTSGSSTSEQTKEESKECPNHAQPRPAETAQIQLNNATAQMNGH